LPGKADLPIGIPIAAKHRKSQGKRGDENSVFSGSSRLPPGAAPADNLCRESSARIGLFRERNQSAERHKSAGMMIPHPARPYRVPRRFQPFRETRVHQVHPHSGENLLVLLVLLVPWVPCSARLVDGRRLRARDLRNQQSHISNQQSKNYPIDSPKSAAYPTPEVEKLLHGSQPGVVP
jgi:hypothetical protein